MSYTVRLTDGRSFPAEDNQGVLEAAEAAGLTLPHGCRRGHCLSCAATLKGGKVDLPQGTALTPDMLRQQILLPCVARVRADTLLELHANPRAWTE